MSERFGPSCNEFSVSTRLFLKLDLPIERHAILNFFDRVKRAFPTMAKMRRREEACIILEESDPDRASRRWMRLDPSCLRFGCIGAEDTQVVRDMGAVILEHAPYFLTFSELDYDHLEVVYGFDLEYRGNHDQLLAETFWGEHPLSALVLPEDAAHIIDAQPYFGVALTPECDLQAYFEVKSRTSTYEVRAQSYEPQCLCVLQTIRRYWGYSSEGKSLVQCHDEMADIADRMAAQRSIPLLVNTLAHAIASRP